MTRPIGKFPQWPVGTTTNYLVPDTFDPAKANYPFGELARWFGVHDGIEVANYSKSYSLDSGSAPIGGSSLWSPPIDTWRRGHLAFDPRGVYYAGVRNAGANDIAGLLWSFDGRNWSYDTSVAQCAGTMTESWYGVVLTDVGNSFAWVTGRNVAVYRQTRAFQRIGHSVSAPFGGYVEFTAVPAGLVIENVAYDVESARMFAVGWDYSTGNGLAYFVDPTGLFSDSWNTYVWSRDVAATGKHLKHVAVAPGYKVIASDTDLWWGQGILSTFRHATVADAMPGETVIKGLIYSDTDKVFIAVGTAKIWVSANGVQWSETSAPPSFDAPLIELYTGAIGCLGGTVVAGAQVSPSPSAAKSFALAVGLNNLRDWYVVPSPTANGTSNPTQNVYALGNRLAVLNTKNVAGVRYSLGTP